MLSVVLIVVGGGGICPIYRKPCGVILLISSVKSHFLVLLFV